MAAPGLRCLSARKFVPRPPASTQTRARPRGNTPDQNKKARRVESSRSQSQSQSCPSSRRAHDEPIIHPPPVIFYLYYTAVDPRCVSLTHRRTKHARTAHVCILASSHPRILASSHPLARRPRMRLCRRSRAPRLLHDGRLPAAEIVWCFSMTSSALPLPTPQQRRLAHPCAHASNGQGSRALIGRASTSAACCSCSRHIPPLPSMRPTGHWLEPAEHSRDPCRHALVQPAIHLCSRLLHALPKWSNLIHSPLLSIHPYPPAVVSWP